VTADLAAGSPGRGGSDPGARLPIGVALGTIGASAEWWLESAKRLETAGYRAVWAWDHLVGRGDKTVPVLEQWTLLAGVAGATGQVRVGTFITNVMRRHPALVARMASTLQGLSRGRFTLGIGIGDGPKEHAAYGMDFPEVGERAARLEEAVAVIRALWSGGPVTRPSPFYPLEGAHAFPLPEPAPLILIGGGSPRGVRIAARIGDGWAAEIDGFERLLPMYRDALAEEGRSVDEAWIALGFGGGRSGEDALRDSPWVAAPRETWARYAEHGVDEVIVTARTPNDVEALEGAVRRW
jgi:alkanesulfonate monooxygenase SsuD/methylene tetrahydromethanopterin reductase-like flavin-dependent oxidoreductase (luciferase family)